MMIRLMAVLCLAIEVQATTLQDFSTELENIAAATKPVVVNIRRLPIKPPEGMPPAPASSNDRRSVREIFSLLESFTRDPTDEAPGPEERHALSIRSLGSGVIVRADGLIITNEHVVGELERVEVALADGRVFPAWLVGRDKATDLAALKIEHDGTETFKHLPLSPSTDIRAGAIVVAIGNAPIIGHTVTMGIVSDTGRRQLGLSEFEDFIQTDSAINKGNSGGPLLDARGRFIGLNSAAFSRQAGFDGIGFSIPAVMVNRILEDFIRVGRAERAYLGLVLRDLPNEGGVVISSFTRRSSFDAEKLQRGDIILTYEGRNVRGAAELRHWIAMTRPGKVALTVRRAGKELALRVHASHATRFAMRIRMDIGRVYRDGDPVPPPISYEQVIMGTDLAGLEELGNIYDFQTVVGYPAREEGVTFRHVLPGSKAEYLGFRPGDALLRIDDTRVRSRKELFTELMQWGPADVHFMLVRDGQSLSLRVPKRGPRAWVEGGVEPAYRNRRLKIRKALAPQKPGKKVRPRRARRGRRR
jgi:serine protease Do